MRIVNGRLYNDFNTGSFTYYSRNSMSTVDYLLSKQRDFRDFGVVQFDIFSDHAPLYFTLKCTGTKKGVGGSRDERNSQSINYRWKD